MPRKEKLQEAELAHYRNEVIEEFHYLLKESIKNKVTDIVLATGKVPYWRSNGKLRQIQGESWSVEQMKTLVGHLLGDDYVIYNTPRAYKAYLDSQNRTNYLDEELVNFYSAELGYDLTVSKAEYCHLEEIDEQTIGMFSYLRSVQELTYRFRVSAFKERGQFRLVLRLIPTEMRDFKKLNLPEPQLEQIANLQRGLVLVTGSTGQGKSTTISSVLEYINSNNTGHIITIEDPIEYIYREKKSLITQREVSGRNRMDSDALDYPTAIKEALRQTPDVIMIGEIRDAATFEAVLTAAESGHLVISAMHTANVSATLQRIISYYKEDRTAILSRLSVSLAAIVSQRLLPAHANRIYTTQRVPAVEILVNCPGVKENLAAGDIPAIQKRMEEGEVPYKMQTFDQALARLFEKGLITPQTAVEFASSPSELKARFMQSDIQLVD